MINTVSLLKIKKKYPDMHHFQAPAKKIKIF